MQELTVARAAKYLADKAEHEAVHGAAAVAGLQQFYDAVASLFASGKLGGVTLVAFKQLTEQKDGGGDGSDGDDSRIKQEL